MLVAISAPSWPNTRGDPQGQATATASGQATGYRNFTLCVQHGPGGPIECRSFQLGMRVEGTAGPTTIQLVPQGRAP